MPTQVRILLEAVPGGGKHPFPETVTNAVRLFRPRNAPAHGRCGAKPSQPGPVNCSLSLSFSLARDRAPVPCPRRDPKASPPCITPGISGMINHGCIQEMMKNVEKLEKLRYNSQQHFRVGLLLDGRQP